MVFGFVIRMYATRPVQVGKMYAVSLFCRASRGFKVMNTDFSNLTHRSRKLFGLSPWLVVGVSVILGLAIIYLAARSNERERRKTSENLMDRANALIWALEAGTRTWMGFQGEQNLLQLLVEETAKQPGIVLLEVANFDGTILAHNDKSMIGKMLPPDKIPNREDIEKIDWRVVNSAEAPTFEVYRLFAPIQDGHGMERGRMGGNHHFHTAGTTHSDDEEEVGGDTFVMVGLDQRPFQDALEADFHNTLLSAFIVAALGLGGFISMFWAHNYQRSKRLLMDAQALASEVVTSLPLGLITCDAEGRIKMVNDTALTMLDKHGEEVTEKNIEGLDALEWGSFISELAKGGKVLEREVELAVSDEKSVPVRLSASQIRDVEGRFLGHLFIFGDIGEVKRLQTEVQRNERLTALGNLAAGVAHEIRNPLSTIKGLVTYIARKLPTGGPEEDAAKTMIIEVNRLNTVVSELLEFARPSVTKGAHADVNEVISRALRLAGGDIQDKNINVKFSPSASQPSVRLNPERFTQALLNIFLNAVQAMRPGGTLHVSTKTRAADNDFCVVIEDDGEGMSDEVRESIFNPYFTTKPSGTGLGLAIVHQIVEGHGGKVTVKSAPGKGSVFTIHLPIDENA